MEKLSKTDWWAPLQTAMGPEYWERVAIFLKDVYGHGEVYPALPNVFAALVATPLADVKVVILGQDPYPNPGQAQGLSFSVPADMGLPKSLVNIYRELADDLQAGTPMDGDLHRWADQGV